MAKLIQGRFWGTQDSFPFQWKESWKEFAYSYKLVCCDSWGRKESDTTERLIWSDKLVNVLQGKKTKTTGVTFISREKSKINV